MPGEVRDALFYRDRYMLLPEGFADMASFWTALKRAPMPWRVHAVVLYEDYDVHVDAYEHGVSLAPYFITDYIEGPELVEIEDAADVYPVLVELLDQKSYNDRLRALVCEYCPGCNGFGGVNENDSSLSGHFGEISLNGVCFLRREGREPRVFYSELGSAAMCVNPNGYFRADAEALLGAFKQNLGLKFDSGEIIETENGGLRLRLGVKKSNIFITELTDMLADVVRAQDGWNYEIELTDRVEANAESVAEWLDPKKANALRKELKKYGVSLAVLEYDAAQTERLTWALAEMEQRGVIIPLTIKPGRVCCLFTSTAAVLMQLRYRAPLMEACNARVTVWDQDKTVRYRISFDMPAEVLDAASAPAAKPKKAVNKYAKFEKGRVLKRVQAKNLFTYLSIRLDQEGCDDTLRFTQIWLEDNLPAEQFAPALEEIREMGGYCDCEVLMNCYQDYELDADE